MMTDEQEYYELYDRFRADVKAGGRDIFYDEDDLVMIYDLAADERDIYTQLEVLMLGRKLYPDSELLLIRQGLMIDPYEEKPMLEFLENNSSHRGVIWDILRLKVPRLSYEDAVEAMDNMLADAWFKDDEEIIQFIELINFYEATPWLVDNYESFLSHCAYRDTALNECARLIEPLNPGMSVGMLEELSRIDPFNSNTWLKLSELYIVLGRTEEAVMAIDYAKAINPEDEAIRDVEKRLSNEQEYSIPADPENEDKNLTHRIVELLANGDKTGALALLTDYDSNHGGVYDNAFIYVHLLYFTGEFERIADFMERKRPDEESRELRMDPLSLVMYAASLLRLGRLEDAVSVARDYLSQAGKASSSLDTKMSLAGARKALDYIIDSAENSRWHRDVDPISEALS